ncbi:MAG TPA: hypothetical protein ENO22_11675 [candidate division Zixibacteria bacterium]|nr:hypothetical protein [candidate division Zixibacteria bacterium]
MRYLMPCLALFLIVLCSQSIAQDLYRSNQPAVSESREIYDLCLTVIFDTSHHINPYEFAESVDFLSFDPRLEQIYLGFYIFHIPNNMNINHAMDLVRLEPSVLMVNPIHRAPYCFPTYMDDELIVRFDPDISDEIRDSLLTEFGLEIINSLLPSYVVRVVGKTDKSTWEIGDDLMATGFFVWAYPNYIYMFTECTKGDLNYDIEVDIEDLVWLVNNIFNNGLGPIGGNLCADLNCDLVLGLEDIIRLVNYLFKGQTITPYE